VTASSAFRPASLRWRFVLLATVAILPVALLCGFALRSLLAQQLAQTERAALDLSRALAHAVDNELRLSIAALETLALVDAMAPSPTGDAAPARALAEAALKRHAEWRALHVLDAAGAIVAGAGDVTRRGIDDVSLARTLQAQRPTVGHLVRDAQGRHGVAVLVPLLRDGQPPLALGAVLRPEAVLGSLRRQRVPDDWVASVLDGEQRRLARSRGAERHVGTAPSPTLAALIATMGERRVLSGETITLEGEPVHAALARLDEADWLVTLGVPQSAMHEAARASAVAYGSGIVLSVLLGGLAAMVAARRIARPVEKLRRAAVALGRGEPVAPVPSVLDEVRTVSDALVDAAQRRAAAEAERERLLEAERLARAGAERAHQRLTLLAEAGSVLAQALEEARALDAIAGLLVPTLADACRIDLLDDSGRLQRKITFHVDPERRRALEDFVARSVASPEVPGTFPWVIRTGQTYVAHFPSPEDVPFKDPGARQFARLVGLRAAVSLPLVARGQTIGALAVMQAESGRDFADDDVALVRELAQRAALALDNVRLFEASRRALHEASAANRAKDDFFAVLGHELRNPLAPIVSALELMARRDPAGSPERQVIERQVRHLMRLVDDLLDVSRIAAGKVALRLEPLDLRDVVARALEAAAPALREHGAVEPRIDGAGPFLVNGDATRLVQVLGNLLINAGKFSEPGTPIELRLWRSDGDRLHLAVRDRGIGIAPELLPRLFERFVQGEQALHRGSGGLGLGLAIARRLVELHGGTIVAESDGPGRGSTFTVTLPAAGSAEPPSHPAPGPSRPRPLRVLVVDDNADAAESLAALLGLEGHAVELAYDGPQALALLDGFAPDVALLDIGLPGMDGYQLARAIRQRPDGRALRLVALTGYGHDSDRARTAAAGFDAHLVKPVEMAALGAVLGG
jgi:signal transduction histidine kinase/CheY-like chemotaxis protein